MNKFYFVLLALALAACSSKESAPEKSETAASAPAAAPASGELKIEDTKVGSGKACKLGDRITVNYKGTFPDGKVFDESKGKPVTFPLKEGMLIKGWTQGIPGMKIGGKRKLFVPWKLAYGERGTPGGPIPPKADLVFEVELVGIQ